MRKERLLSYASAINSDLSAAETIVSDAHTAAFNLLSRMIAAKAGLGLPTFGNGTVSRAARVFSLICEAQEELALAHAELGDHAKVVSERFGVDLKMAGIEPGEKERPPGPVGRFVTAE